MNPAARFPRLKALAAKAAFALAIVFSAAFASAGCAASGPDASADALSERLDPQTRPYYAALGETEREEYRNILAGMLEGRATVDLREPRSEDSVEEIVESVMADQPDIFWVDDYYVITRGDRVVAVEFESLYGDRDLEQMRDELDAAVQQIVDPLVGQDPVQQEKAVFDAVSRTVAYDESGIDQGQGAYAALVEGKAVCAGYSRAYQLLMMELGVPCYYVVGEAEGEDPAGEGEDPAPEGWGPHAWNMVQIEGDFYNLDVTWADSSIFNEEGVSYDCYNRTDLEFSATHARDAISESLPACDTEFDFQDAYGEDPAAASLESAGFEVDAVVEGEFEYADSVVSDVRELFEGGITYVAVAYGMDDAAISSARDAALDGLTGYIDPGSRVSVYGMAQEYSPGVLLIIDEYEIV